jgi:hypothetical protein
MTKLPAQQQALNVQPFLREAEGLTHSLNQDGVVGPQCPKHVDLDEIPE